MPKQLASTLHLLLCKQNHQHECNWYLEDQAVERWKLPEHKKWLSKAEGIVLISGQSSEEIENLFRNLIGIISSLSFIKAKNKELADIIDTILIETTKVG